MLEKLMRKLWNGSKPAKFGKRRPPARGATPIVTRAGGTNGAGSTCLPTATTGSVTPLMVAQIGLGTSMDRAPIG